MKRDIFKFLKSNKGLTLVEILVVAGLIAFVSVLVVRNFNYSRLNLERVANVMASDIRLAQQLAMSAHQYQGSGDPAPRNRCGYGVTGSSKDDSDPNNDTRRYSIYAGPPTVNPDGTPNNNCGQSGYERHQDEPFYKSNILDSRINFNDNPGLGLIFDDIFFVPPGPTVYYKNNTILPIDSWTRITIKRNDLKINTGAPSGRCSSGLNKDCIYICIYGSGRIEVSKTYTCP